MTSTTSVPAGAGAPMAGTAAPMPGTAGATTTTKQPEFDQPPADPIALLQRWYETAGERNVNNPGALALGTVDDEGHTSVRIVATIDITDDGLLFTSHTGSRKGRDMAEHPWASGALYWRETSQQITLAGPVRKLSDAESDELWATRPTSTYPMSVASQQSAPLTDEEALRAEAARLAESDQPLERPAGWAGYLLTPTTVEFWQGSPDRLHRRLRYDRTDDGWTAQRLQP